VKILRNSLECLGNRRKVNGFTIHSADFDAEEGARAVWRQPPSPVGGAASFLCVLVEFYESPLEPTLSKTAMVKRLGRHVINQLVFVPANNKRSVGIDKLNIEI
jgi:hypothetical protein